MFPIFRPKGGDVAGCVPFGFARCPHRERPPISPYLLTSKGGEPVRVADCRRRKGEVIPALSGREERAFYSFTQEEGERAAQRTDCRGRKGAAVPTLSGGEERASSGRRGLLIPSPKKKGKGPPRGRIAGGERGRPSPPCRVERREHPRKGEGFPSLHQKSGRAAQRTDCRSREEKPPSPCRVRRRKSPQRKKGASRPLKGIC